MKVTRPVTGRLVSPCADRNAQARAPAPRRIKKVRQDYSCASAGSMPGVSRFKSAEVPPPDAAEPWRPCPLSPTVVYPTAAARQNFMKVAPLYRALGRESGNR